LPFRFVCLAFHLRRLCPVRGLKWIEPHNGG
jgi:hypothetical protein